LITATTAPLSQPEEARVEAGSDARHPVKLAYVAPVVERLGHWQVHTMVGSDFQEIPITP
jgi:hypothetical protein